MVCRWTEMLVREGVRGFGVCYIDFEKFKTALEGTAGGYHWLPQAAEDRSSVVVAMGGLVPGAGVPKPVCLRG